MKKIDLHAHSSLQPYGQTFHKNPSKDDIAKRSLWYFNPPKGLKGVGEKIGLSSYSQSNLTSAGMGDVRVVSVALYPPEISFFKNKLPERIGLGVENIVTRFSVDRIKDIEDNTYRYFDDLVGQMNFMSKFDGSVSPNNNYRCVIAKNYDDVRKALDEPTTNTIVMIFNVEGGHSLDCGYPDDINDDEQTPLTEPQKKAILDNINTLKNSAYPILYFTLCHHFYNQLCGHSKSLPGILKHIISQEVGIDLPMTTFGEEVVTRLLDPTLGRSIYIDVKHMSLLGRKRYYEMHQEFKDKRKWDIPIIYSHGGPNGFADESATQKNNNLNPADLGLYDWEVFKIAESNGFIGLNIDQRVMSSPDYQETVKHKTFLAGEDKKQYWWSSIIFENMKYLAELLQSKNYAPWDFVCMGTDFDGAINPVNFFLEEADLPDLAAELQQHVADYYAENTCPLTPGNRLAPEEVINKLMYKNAQQFLARWFV